MPSQHDRSSHVDTACPAWCESAGRPHDVDLSGGFRHDSVARAVGLADESTAYLFVSLTRLDEGVRPGVTRVVLSDDVRVVAELAVAEARLLSAALGDSLAVVAADEQLCAAGPNGG